MDPELNFCYQLFRTKPEILYDYLIGPAWVQPLIRAFLWQESEDRQNE